MNVIRAILEVVPGGVIRAGKTAYADDAFVGFWLGVDSDGAAKFNLGGSSYYLKWTGERLEIAGGLKTKNGYVQIVDESTEDYGEGMTLLQAAWLASGALRWKSAGPAGRAGALVVANNNGSGGTDLLIHAYPRTTGAGNKGTISLYVHDKAYGESGANVYGLSISSSGQIQTTANLRLGGAVDQVQLRVDACVDGQAADLVRVYDAGEAICFRVEPDGDVDLAGVLKVDGVQVVGSRQGAIGDLAETGSAEDGACRAKVNDILAALRAHGLIEG